MNKNSRYRSARIELRGLSLDDAEDVVRWRSNPDNYCMFFHRSPLTMAEHLDWFGRYLRDDKCYSFVIVELTSYRSIGTAGLSEINRAEGTCQVSYMLGERWARGKGYATEAVELLCSVAQSELGIRTIDALILPQNVPSMRVVGRAGFEEAYIVFRRSLP